MTKEKMKKEAYTVAMAWEIFTDKFYHEFSISNIHW